MAAEALRMSSEHTPTSLFNKPSHPARYPGRYDERDKEAKEITGNTEHWEGVRFDWQRGLSGAFSTTHLISMNGSEQASGAYSYNTTYSTPKLHLIGRYDGEGRTIGRVIYSPTNKITTVVQSQVTLEPAQTSFTLEADYKGEDSHSQVKLENKGVLVLSYMQSIYDTATTSLAAGAELLHLPAQGTLLNAALRVTTEPKDKSNHWIFGATFNTAGQATVNATRRLSEKVELSTEYMRMPTPDGSTQDTWAAGGLFTFRNSRIKARWDNMWRTGAIIEETVASFMRLSLSAELDHTEQKYKFGFGISLAL
jgi:hypothetical protein